MPWGVGEKAGPFFLGDDGPGGTAQVEVHLVVAQVLQTPGGADEIIGLVGQQLGDHGHALVVFRQDIVQAPAGERAVGGGGGEGRIIPGQAGKPAVVDPAEEPAGDPLQRGEGQRQSGLSHGGTS